MTTKLIDRVRLYSNSDTVSVKTKDKEDIAIGDLCLVQYTCFDNYIYHTSYEVIHSIDENSLLRDDKNNIIPREFVKIVYDGTSLKSTLLDSFKIKDDMNYADRMSKFLNIMPFIIQEKLDFKYKMRKPWSKIINEILS